MLAIAGMVAIVWIFVALIVGTLFGRAAAFGMGSGEEIEPEAEPERKRGIL